jgi:threonylcarbamoyladenosine tRNA methylthiotransferase MtaB
VALGCRVNRADLDALAAGICGRFELAREGEPADLVVVNTCTITSDADSAARRAIRRAAREHPAARIVAAGCYAEVCPGALARLPGVAAVVGARAQAAVPLLLEGLAAGKSGEEALARAAGGAPAWTAAPLGPARHTRPFLKVQDGCDRRCAFCVVPGARGPSRSLPMDEALRRVALLGERHREVVLTGVHLGAYGRDLTPRRSLADLVRAVTGGALVHRLRLSSVEPDELPRGLLHERRSTAGLCEHFHLPLQSGSRRILAAMRRPTRPEGFRRVVEEIAAAVPRACIGTDVMAGFPGETDADHRETVAIAEALPLAYLHVFPFSPRPGTPAAKLPGRVASAVMRARARELLAVSDRKWRAFLGAQTGRELEVVVERIDGGLARGTARRYVTVRLPAAGIVRGSLASVRIEGNDGQECFGVRA